MNHKYTLTPLFLIFWGLALMPAAPPGPGISGEPGGISFNIRYYDKRVYYLDGDPILIQATLINNSPSPYRFRLADERAFSMDFDVRTNSNKAVDAADYLVRRRSQSQQVYFRDISIEPGESFSFVEDLRNYAFLNLSGSYVVLARIYPELYPAYYSGDAVFNGIAGINPGRTLAASGVPLESNRLSLSLRPRSILGSDGIPLELDVETNAVLVRGKLPPDQVVRYLLTARQKGQWEKFFLYLDLDSMISRDAYRKRQWNAESEEGRQRMVARYRQDLQNTVTDGDISLIPMDFTIERTVYNAADGNVTVLEYFKAGAYTEKKRFTWYLQKKDEIWTIVDYSVVNLGTE